MSDTSPIHIRRAGPDDVPLITELLAEGSDRMAELGLGRPWPVPFPRERITAPIEAGVAFMIERPSESPFGTFLLTWETDSYWTGQAAHESGYLHRLTVRRRMAGQRVTEQVVAWVVQQVRAANRGFVRLDCLAGAHRLRRYYESFGFRYVANATVREFDLALYEMDLRSPDPGSATRAASTETSPGV